MLPVLLSRVVGGMAAGVEEPPLPSLAVWSNMLRCVREEGSEHDLPTTARISRRLAVSAVTGAARRGWITATKGDRGRTVVLTGMGRAADQAWQQRIAALDRKWCGSDLRAALEALVGQLPVELPWYPASYGTADPSAVGGPFVPLKPGSGLPPHGEDWRWVLRGPEADTVSGIPTTALVSQALVAFAIGYEARARWPLASTTLVVRHLNVEPKPLADVPGDHGITANGKSLLERHGVAVVTRDLANGRKVVRLTPRGERIKSEHDGHLAAVEQAWRGRFGESVMDDLRTALQARKYASDERLPDHVVAPLHLG